ncbi:MAG: patatin-like phospholipase family protein [Woeseiaceae bacterium]|jgi:NTE family protein|nr:patatin-like phospholipase family protein [Woeseiaceae bacterium]
MKQDGKKISLVLGSGGARGLAHIGVIRELEAHGFEIASIAGCSFGALVGGVYAAGKLDEFEEWVSAFDNVALVKLLDIAWEKNGLVKGDRVIETLTELVGDVRIDDFDIPFTAVATDIRRQKEVWLNSGSLFFAVRASGSLPFFLTPVRYKDSYLIDGGVLNPVPIAPTFNDDTDLTIAVNLSGPPADDPAAVLGDDPDDHDDASNSSGLRQKLKEFLSDLHDSFADGKQNLGMYDIGSQAFDAMQGAIARHKLAAYPPDYTIEIPRNVCGTLDFDKGRQLIRLGRERAKDVLAGFRD